MHTITVRWSGSKGAGHVVYYGIGCLPMLYVRDENVYEPHAPAAGSHLIGL